MPSVTPALRSPRIKGFTLAEVLAALLFMAIVIPVAMQGMSVASRAGILGQRKAAAIRVAERVIAEQLLTGTLSATTSSGSIEEDDVTYPWTMTSETWPEDTMTEITVKVSFDLQGRTYDVSASTLYDPNASSSSSSSSTSSSTSS